MKYGMCFKLDVYWMDEQRADEIITSPGDYMRMTDWMKANMEDDGTTAHELATNYAIAWFAMRRLGKTDGIPAQLSRDAILDMADRFTVYVNNVEDDSLPLAR